MRRVFEWINGRRRELFMCEMGCFGCMFVGLEVVASGEGNKFIVTFDLAFGEICVFMRIEFLRSIGIGGRAGYAYKHPWMVASNRVLTKRDNARGFPRKGSNQGGTLIVQ